MPNGPQEFTPELSEELLAGLRRGVEKRGARQVGLARGEALERGLTGDPFEAAAVGGARAETGRELSDLASQFAYRRAGLQREERMIGEQRGYQTGEREARQEFVSAEAEKDRALRERIAQMQGGDDEFLTSLIGMGGQIGGAMLGGPIGGALGGGLSSMFQRKKQPQPSYESHGVPYR